mgnify:CR=1 FL=1
MKTLVIVKSCVSLIFMLVSLLMNIEIQLCWIQPSFQYTGKVFKALLVQLSPSMSGKLNINDHLVFYGHLRSTLDGGFIAKLYPSPQIYLKSLSATSRTIECLDCFSVADPLDSLTELIHAVCLVGRLQRKEWNQLALLLLACVGANKGGARTNLLIVSDDSNMVNKVVSRFSCVEQFRFGCQLGAPVEKRKANSVVGGSFDVQHAGPMGGAGHDMLIYIEDLNLLKPGELKEVEKAEGGIIAICSTNTMRKLSDFASVNFDLVAIVSEGPGIEEASFLLDPSNLEPFQLMTTVKADNLFLEEGCESMIQEYFLASRTVIGKDNESARLPIFDPGHQLGLSMSIVRAFELIVPSTSRKLTKIHTLLSLLVQDINLKNRLDKTVFEGLQSLQEVPMPLPSGLPSPCPTAISSARPKSILERYMPVLDEIKALLMI